MKPMGRAGGFTLLELLVAISITLLLAGIVLSVTTGTLTIWRHAQDNVSTNAQAKLALDMIERDLQSAHHRKEEAGTVWLAVDVINIPETLVNHGWQIPLSPGFMKPATTESQSLVSPATDPKIADARFGLSGAWLRFIGTNVEAAGSLPVAISYQLARRPLTGTDITAANPADVRYTLFRAAVSAANTFASGNDVTVNYASAAQKPAAPRTAATLTNPNTSDALATNVVDLGVWLFARNSDGSLRRIFPAASNDTSHTATDAIAPPDASMFPEVVDVMIRILTEEGSRQLDALERNNGSVTRPVAYPSDALWWWAVVEANSHVYARRVEMRSTAQ